MYNKSIFIFRRDLRINDNTALIEALTNSKICIPIFILTPEQLVNNAYKSDNSVQFMMESLDDLDEALRDHNSKLRYFFGHPHIVIDKLIRDLDIDAVFVNRDYTPYSRARDANIKKVCDKYDTIFESFEDVLMHPVGSVRNMSGSIYVKYTPFFNTVKKLKVPDIRQNRHTNYYLSKNKIVGEYHGDIHKFYEYNKNLCVNGGRVNALKILAGISKFKSYNTTRDLLNINTTRLSAYIKFGCVSIREVYHAFHKKLGPRNGLIRQLYWREFYYNILEYYPNTLSTDLKVKNFKASYKKVPWIKYSSAITLEQKKQWKAWTTGMTGFPIVDACMRELIETGYMHNRGRLIVASFLVKNMFFHYSDGEKFFAQYLCDYDPANNIGGWGWVSGSHVDTQPYFRIFNPWLQSEKFDPDCKYIKKWVPELSNVANKHIHEWYTYCSDNQYDKIDYPEPIIDYKTTAAKAIAKYKKAFQ